MVFDHDMDPFLQNEITWEDKQSASMIIQVIYDPESGFTHSRTILNRQGGIG